MSPIRMSRLESSIRIIIEFTEAFNRHDIAGIMRLISDDCVLESTDPNSWDAVYSGKSAITAFWQDFFREAPDAHIDIEEIFGMGFRCVLRWKYSPGNKNDQIRGVSLFKIKNERIAEILSYDIARN